MSGFRDFLKNIQGDKVIISVVGILAAISIAAIYSTMHNSLEVHAEYYLLKQIPLMIAGFITLYIAYKIPYKYYARYANPLLIAAICLLILTFIIGISKNGEKRWLRISFFTFQPSDLAKPILMIYLAKMLTIKQDMLDNFKDGLLQILIVIAIVIGLILPSNGSTAIILFASSMLMIFFAGGKIKHLAGIVGIGIVLLLGIYGIYKVSDGHAFRRMGTWIARIENFSQDTDEKKAEGRTTTYNPTQRDFANNAIKGGGWFGRGPGKSIERNNLSQAESDFIYAIIIEEFGFVVGVFVLLCYLIIAFRSVQIAIKSPGTFSALLSIGLSFLIVLQALTNMSVAVGLFPTTGQPLPLVSKGGTSFLVTCAIFGILIGLSRNTQPQLKIAGEEHIEDDTSSDYKEEDDLLEQAEETDIENEDE